MKITSEREEVKNSHLYCGVLGNFGYFCGSFNSERFIGSEKVRKCHTSVTYVTKT